MNMTIRTFICEDHYGAEIGLFLFPIQNTSLILGTKPVGKEIFSLKSN